ncbi:MAG: helix-turn-helix domain-containing protein [Verrucomicrobia bacterium]|nr:helix-turn-helix domain-containing protein [Verrucomicrobiota bacterium]
MFKPSEAAHLIRVHRCTIYGMIKRGSLPAIRVGKTLRIRKEDLQAFLS